MSRSTRRRAAYTRASDVTVMDATTREPIAHQRRYSPAELNSVKSARNPKRVREIVRKKQAAAPNQAVRRYLEIVNTDN